MRAGKQIGQASKQENEQCGSNPPKGVPQANSHSTWALVSQGGHLWPIANWEQRYATYLQREIRTVPVRSEDGETRLGDRGLLPARSGVTAQSAGAVGGAPPSPDWGKVAVRRRRSRPSGDARVGVCGDQLALRVRSALARTRARAGGSASAWAWGSGGRLPGDERRGEDPLVCGCVGQHVLGRPSSVPSGAFLVGVLTTPTTRRQPGRGSVLSRVGVGSVPRDRLPPGRVHGAALAGWSSSLPGCADLVGVLTTPATRRKPGRGSVFCRHGAISCLRAHAQVEA